MSRKFIIAVLVVAAGWYFYSKGSLYQGTFEAGVYTDEKHGFTLCAPDGWKQAAVRDISPANGYTIPLPRGPVPSLLLVSTGADKSVVFLRRAWRGEFKEHAMQVLNKMRNSVGFAAKPRHEPASNGRLERIKTDAVLEDGELIYISFFSVGDTVFMLVGMSPKGFTPQTLYDFNRITDSARAITES